MTIRLTKVTDGKTTTIHIEGFLVGVDVPDLRTAYELATAPCRIDVSDLRAADTDGIRALQSLLESGAELHGANSYVRQLLAEDGK